MFDLHDPQLRTAYTKPEVVKSARRIARKYPTGLEELLRLRVAIENDPVASRFAEADKQAIGSMIACDRLGVIPFPVKGVEYPAGQWHTISFRALSRNPKIVALASHADVVSKELRQFLKQGDYTIRPVDPNNIFYKPQKVLSHSHRPVEGGYPWAQEPTFATLFALHDNLEEAVERAVKFVDAFADVSLYAPENDPQEVVKRLKGVANVFDTWNVLTGVHYIKRPWGVDMREEGLPSGEDVALGVVSVSEYQEARRRKDQADDVRYYNMCRKWSESLAQFAKIIDGLGTTHAPTVSRYLNKTATGFKIHRSGHSRPELEMPHGQWFVGPSMSVEDLIADALKSAPYTG
jgi:hypothetical protein